MIKGSTGAGAPRRWDGAGGILENEGEEREHH